MSMSKERLLQEYAAGGQGVPQDQGGVRGRAPGVPQADSSASDEANDRLVKARAAVLARMTDEPKAPQVGQPGGPFGPKQLVDNTPALDKLSEHHIPRGQEKMLDKAVIHCGPWTSGPQLRGSPRG